MLFQAPERLPILACTRCRSLGVVRWRTCPECKGMAAALVRRSQWLYWSYPLERYHLAYRRAREIFNKVRFVIFLVAGLILWFWAGAILSRGNILSAIQDPVAFVALLKTLPTAARELFLTGGFVFMYLWYRSISERRVIGTVEHYQYDESAPAGSPSAAAVPPDAPAVWPDVKRFRRSARRNIADTFTKEALAVLGQVYQSADQAGRTTITPLQVFYGLLSSTRISNLFIRLGIPSSYLIKQLEPILASEPSNQNNALAPVVAPDVWQILFTAYEEAYQAHQEYVSVTELFVAAVRFSESIQDLLSDLAVNQRKLLNVVEWARVRERLHRQYLKLHSAAGHRSKHGLDRAMTAVATPYLDKFSEDVTMLAQFGRTEPCIARETELEEIFRVVEAGQENVVVVGDFGVGKRSIIEGLAERMVEDDVPGRLQDKRLVRLSVSSLLAGTTAAGAVERLIAIMNEIIRAGNIILFIHNIHELIGVSAGGSGQGLDVAGTLADYLNSGRFMTIATTTTEDYAQHIASSKLSSLFSRVDINEMSEDQAIQVLESKAGYAECKQQVFFSYDALEKAAHFAKLYIRDTYLPGSALEVMSEAASLAHRKKGVNSLVTADEVAAVVSEKTRIPVTAVTADESAKLLHLEEAMHQRVIGQDEAVGLVANALRRARAEIRSTAKPIANFLFLGPTGVGKTELAKTIAEVYFGGENRMLRLDMSEYQDKASIYRLIGSPGQKASGVLTEGIRHNPFALLLLDEIEKADKDILNLFLQVMDDGRLTDSMGKVVDFTNVILIATSNAGTSYVQEQMRAGLSSEAIKDRLLHGELKDYFRPEFLNRFDGIVLFKPLDTPAIRQIAGLYLKRIGKDLEAKGMELRVTEPALDYFAKIGFDPEFGARPLRRTIQERVENQLAELLLSGKLKRKDVVEIGAEGKIEVK